MPLDIYKANLRKIINHTCNTTAQTQTTRVILVTPPPINEYALEDSDAAKGVFGRRRTAEHTMMYADACKSVGRELDISVLDLWALCMKEAQCENGDLLPGSKKVERNRYLDQVLSDGIIRAPHRYSKTNVNVIGLHLSPAGYRLLFEFTMLHIENTWPDQTPDQLDFVYPPWRVAPGGHLQ